MEKKNYTGNELATEKYIGITIAFSRLNFNIIVIIKKTIDIYKWQHMHISASLQPNHNQT